jgi:hypothetical protein
VADLHGLPLAGHAAAAPAHEVTLVRDALAESFCGGPPRRPVGDKAYDSDRLDAELAERGIEMIAPHKSNRVKE